MKTGYTIHIQIILSGKNGSQIHKDFQLIDV